MKEYYVYIDRDEDYMVGVLKPLENPDFDLATFDEVKEQDFISQKDIDEYDIIYLKGVRLVCNDKAFDKLNSK